MSKTISRSVMPIGTSTRPVFTNLPGQGEDLGAFALLGADAGEPIAAVADDRRNVGEGFDVIDEGRLAKQPRFSRIRRAGTRRAALAFDRGDQRGFFAAHKSARAEPQIRRGS